MLTEGDFHVYLLPFDGDIEGCVTMDEDCFYSIYINANLPPDRQRKVLDHELNHILNNDFYNDKPIYDIELNKDKDKDK